MSKGTWTAVILTRSGILHCLGRCGARHGEVFVVIPGETVVGFLYGARFDRYCRRCWSWP